MKEIKLSATHFESVDNFSGNCCFTDVGIFGEFVALAKLAVGGLIAANKSCLKSMLIC